MSTLIKLTEQEQSDFQILVMDFFCNSFLVLEADWSYTVSLLKENHNGLNHLLENTPDMDGDNWANRAALVRSYEALKNFLVSKNFTFNEAFYMFGASK